MKSTTRTLFWQSAVVFLSGIIVSVAVERVFDLSAEVSTDLFIALVAVFVAFAAFTLGALYTRVSEQIDLFGLTTIVVQEPTASGSTYEKAKELVLSAKKSILIFSQYTPVQPNVEFPTSRRDYLSEGIEAMIKKHMGDTAGQVFTYTRIIQSAQAKTANGVLQRNFIEGDPQTFEHCKRLSKILSETTSSSVNVEFRMSEPVPSFPSMMIVDDRYVLLGFVTKPLRLETSHKKTFVAGALIIEDRRGQTIEGFKNIFRRFYQDSDPIETIQEVALPMGPE